MGSTVELVWTAPCAERLDNAELYVPSECLYSEDWRPLECEMFRFASPGSQFSQSNE